MKTCKTCKHWKNFNDRHRIENDKFKECSRIKFDRASSSSDSHDDQDSIFDEPAVTVDGSGYFAALHTQENFGCSLHEQ